jgi:hypothetical protein
VILRWLPFYIPMKGNPTGAGLEPRTLLQFDAEWPVDHSLPRCPYWMKEVVIRSFIYSKDVEIGGFGVGFCRILAREMRATHHRWRQQSGGCICTVSRSFGLWPLPTAMGRDGGHMGPSLISPLCSNIPTSIQQLPKPCVRSSTRPHILRSFHYL